jgi:alkanesulfonate monooxygenase SsuD/methylene tetrahydromethanopterin reductase-like flavin-dependent oxidoreductase (luciferase family)
MALYRQNYRPSERFPKPYGALCVWAMAAETEAEAARLFSSREMWRLGRDRGVFAALPSPEEAAAYTYSEAEMMRIERLRSRAIYGTPAVVADKLRALAADHGVEEIAILTTLHDPQARQRSYTLLAQEFGLTAQIPLAAD